MKERKKVGNIGLNEINQKTQEIIDETKRSAGVLVDYFEVDEDNPEFKNLEVDEDGKILSGTREDGSHYSYRLESETIDELRDKNKKLDDEKVDKEEGKELIDSGVAGCFGTVDNNMLEATVDEENKVISYRKKDGTKVENVGIETPEINTPHSSLKDSSLNIDDHSLESYEDIEERSEVVLDGSGKIISYRKKDGTKVENVGVKSKNTESEVGNIDKLNSDEINVRQLNTYGAPNPTKKTEVYLERPKFAEFYFYGELPTDQSEARTPTTLDFVYKVNGQTLFSSKCTLAIQGHGSKNYAKKGYTFEPINADGDAIDIKWGDMIAVDSYHLKAYFSDRTHSRGVGGAKVWRNLVETLGYPYDKVNNKILNLDKDQKIDAYCIADAKYSEDGFPCAFYLNDTFHGLYTLKLKKNRKNYGMEKSNKKEIFLDCLGFDDAPGHSAKLDDPFDAGAWDLKNPKLKNYEEGGPITDATVLARIERLFYFTNNILTEYQNHEDYIVLPHWLTWFIHCELIGDGDKNGNNLELATWDGIHWSILPYDMDLTVGCYGGGNILPTFSDYILRTQFYIDFRTVYENELKQLYTKFRRSGVIEINKLYKTYLNQINSIPRFFYEKDKERWPNGIWDDNEWPVLEQIYSFLQSRIEYLDSIWLLNDDTAVYSSGLLIKGNLLEVESDAKADFELYNASDPTEIITAEDVDIIDLEHLVPDQTTYFKGNLIKVNISETEEPEYICKLVNAMQTSEEPGQTYIRVHEAIEEAMLLEPDVPSTDIYYVTARPKSGYEVTRKAVVKDSGRSLEDI